MKISAMYPSVLTSNPEAVIAFYEKYFNFRIIHQGTAVHPEETDEKIYTLENEKGVRFDVVHYSGYTTAIHGMRVNVDNFEEALEVYRNEGFKPVSALVVSNRSKRILLSKNGSEPILMMQHLK